ncbi:MAG: hypothetical protein Q9217_006012 [Psora testacea]
MSRVSNLDCDMPPAAIVSHASLLIARSSSGWSTFQLGLCSALSQLKSSTWSHRFGASAQLSAVQDQGALIICWQRTIQILHVIGEILEAMLALLENGGLFSWAQSSI